MDNKMQGLLSTHSIVQITKLQNSVTYLPRFFAFYLYTNDNINPPFLSSIIKKYYNTANNSAGLCAINSKVM